MHCAWLEKLVAEAIGVVASDATENSFRLLTMAWTLFYPVALLCLRLTGQVCTRPSLLLLSAQSETNSLMLRK